MGSVFVLTLRALGRGRRLLVIAILLAVPALLALAFVASSARGDSGRFIIGLFENLVLPILLPLTALVFATSALGGEIEDRTLVYLTLRPVSRLAIVAAKALAATLLTVVMVEVSLAVTYLIAARGAGSGAELGALLLAGLGGSVAYAGLFLLAGLLMPRRALLLGFIYVLAWEGTAAGFSTALATLSVRRYVLGALHAGLGSSPLAGLAPSSVSGAASAVVLVLVAVAGVALSTWRLKRMEQA